MIELPKEFSFHHLGYATERIAVEMPFFEMLGYHLEDVFFEDIHQGVRGCFMVGKGPRVELLENLPESKTLDVWLKTNTRIYHVAYMVKDLEKSLEWVRGNRGHIIVPPIPAIAFNNAKISFVKFRKGLLLELIEDNSHAKKTVCRTF